MRAVPHCQHTHVAEDRLVSLASIVTYPVVPCVLCVSISDAEYELEEVWDGKQWHVTKKLVSKKPASSKGSEKPSKQTDQS